MGKIKKTLIASLMFLSALGVGNRLDAKHHHHHKQNLVNQSNSVSQNMGEQSISSPDINANGAITNVWLDGEQKLQKLKDY